MLVGQNVGFRHRFWMLHTALDASLVLPVVTFRNLVTQTRLSREILTQDEMPHLYSPIVLSASACLPRLLLNESSFICVSVCRVHARDSPVVADDKAARIALLAPGKLILDRAISTLYLPV
jgi:hypothetical protein